MWSYILRRLLLMIPTILGITVICFTITQMVPGGPVEQYINKVRMASIESGETARELSEDEIQNIKEYFGYDKPPVERYFNWLINVIQLDFGNSFTYDEPVWDVVKSRFPVSIFFGLTSFLLSYVICIPLGVWKAIKAGSKFDIFSSMLIFTGYVIPGYALGILFIVFLAGGNYMDLFPMSGIISDDYEDYTLLGQLLDFLHHMFLPLSCYMIGEFAVLTLLMKNSLLEEISKEYVRTAQMKGYSKVQAIFKHSLRNALIPITTRVSELFGIFFAGALLIEKVFDIDGMGLLYFNAMEGRDYNLVMAIILMTSVLGLLGRLFSDILYVVVDPRIKLS